GTEATSRNNGHALAALGLPTQAFGRPYQYSFLTTCSIPKLFLSGDRDQFAPKPALENIVSTASDPKHLVFLPGADHFFARHLESMQNPLAAGLKGQVRCPPPATRHSIFSTPAQLASSPRLLKPAASNPHLTGAFASKATPSSASYPMAAAPTP